MAAREGERWHPARKRPILFSLVVSSLIVVMLAGGFALIAGSLAFTEQALAAKSCPVRDANGVREGTVRKSDKSYWILSRPTATLIAVVFPKSRTLWYARNAGTAEGGFYIRRYKTGTRWRILNWGRTRVVGRVIHKRRLWIVQERRGAMWVTVGSVSDRCPAWAAGGAVAWLAADWSDHMFE